MTNMRYGLGMDPFNEFHCHIMTPPIGVPYIYLVSCASRLLSKPTLNFDSFHMLLIGLTFSNSSF